MPAEIVIEGPFISYEEDRRERRYYTVTYMTDHGIPANTECVFGLRKASQRACGIAEKLRLKVVNHVVP